MTKILERLSLLLTVLMVAAGFASCSDDKEETHTPTVTLSQVLAGKDIADVHYTVADATTAVYKVLKAGEAVPTAEELLASSDAKALSTSGTKLSLEGLEPDTEYTIVAAAAYGDKFKSQLATISFTTLFETDTYTFKSAVGSFLQRDEATNTALYTLDFSTNEFNDETTMPLSHLYVTLTGENKDIDLRDLKVPTGTFTVGDFENPKAGNFYPGVMNSNNEAANTFVGSLSTSVDEVKVKLIKDGTITINALPQSQYEVTVSFIATDGTHIEGSYKGSLVVDNNSAEIPEAQILPLPESNLESNTTVSFDSKKQYGMITNYGNSRFGITNRDELFLSLYTDDSYAECVDIYLLVNTDKYGAELPVGKYPVIPKIDWSNISANHLCAEPAWRVADAEGKRVDLGTWYTWTPEADGTPDWKNQKKAPFVAGEVEVVKADTDFKDVDIKFTLTDAKGHTVTGEYKGALDVNKL